MVYGVSMKIPADYLTLNQYILFNMNFHFQNPENIRVLEEKPMEISRGANTGIYLSYPGKQKNNYYLINNCFRLTVMRFPWI